MNITRGIITVCRLHGRITQRWATCTDLINTVTFHLLVEVLFVGNFDRRVWRDDSRSIPSYASHRHVTSAPRRDRQLASYNLERELQWYTAQAQ